MSSQLKSLKVFLIFSENDEDYKQKLATHLSLLERQKLVSIWDKTSILGGAEVEASLDSFIRDSDCVMALLSSDFWHSDECFTLLEKTVSKTYKIEPGTIGILLRPCELEIPIIKSITILPENQQPISVSPNQDITLKDIASFLRHIAVKYISKIHQDNITRWIKECENDPSNIYNKRQLAGAYKLLAEFKDSYFHDSPENDSIQLFKKALSIHETLSEQGSKSYIALSQKGDLLRDMDEPEKAEASYKAGLELNPKDQTLLSKVSALQLLQGRYQDALEVYESIIELEKGKNYITWSHYGDILEQLKQYREAIEAHKRASKINPSYRYSKYKQKQLYLKIKSKNVTV